MKELYLNEETYMGAELWVGTDGKLTVADYGDALSIQLSRKQAETLADYFLHLSRTLEEK